MPLFLGVSTIFQTICCEEYLPSVLLQRLPLISEAGNPRFLEGFYSFIIKVHQAA
ncbi:hypothetical protein ABIA18_005878 [Sinorhizobium fredii]